MTMSPDLLDVVAGLKSRGDAFCLATVVRTVSVTAAKAGAKAVIRPDGSISDGWIGGGCARGAVLKAAREALQDGQPRLVSIVPKDLLGELGIRPGDERDGVRFAGNHCPSQGTMDIFIEPMLPRPALLIVGGSPVAAALAELAPRFGYRVTPCGRPEDQAAFASPDTFLALDAVPVPADAARFVIVSTQGRGDEAALKAALSWQAEFVAFVGSRRKLAALQAALAADGVAADALARLKGPAGLDLGAITPEEIALSILAELLAMRRKGQRRPA